MVEIQKKQPHGRAALNVFKIMIGQLHGDDILYFVELRNGVNLALNRIGFDNGNYLAVRQHTMHFNAFKRSNPNRNGIGAAIKTADNNS